MTYLVVNLKKILEFIRLLEWVNLYLLSILKNFQPSLFIDSFSHSILFPSWEGLNFSATSLYLLCILHLFVSLSYILDGLFWHIFKLYNSSLMSNLWFNSSIEFLTLVFESFSSRISLSFSHLLYWLLVL